MQKYLSVKLFETRSNGQALISILYLDNNVIKKITTAKSNFKSSIDELLTNGYKLKTEYITTQNPKQFLEMLQFYCTSSHLRASQAEELLLQDYIK